MTPESPPGSSEASCAGGGGLFGLGFEDLRALRTLAAVAFFLTDISHTSCKCKYFRATAKVTFD